jgi:hypothetical protein
MLNILYSETLPQELDLLIDRPDAEDCAKPEGGLFYWIGWIGDLLAQDSNCVLEIVGRTNRLRMSHEGHDYLRSLTGLVSNLFDLGCEDDSKVFPHQGRWVEIHFRRTVPDRFQVKTFDGYKDHGPVVYDQEHTVKEIVAVHGRAYRRVIDRVRQLDPAVLDEPSIKQWMANVEKLLAQGER